LKTPRLVLFDLGNVLVRYYPERFWKTLGLDADGAKAPFEQGVRKVTVQYESGECSTEEYFRSLGAAFDGRCEAAMLLRAFESVLTDPIPGMEELVRKVAERVPSALVSNTNDYHLNKILPKVPALAYLPKRYVSYQLHVMKPLPGFYEQVIRNESVDRDEMLFIDDVEDNVTGAVQAGMIGYQFRNTGELETLLIERGIL
jgi:HAD superfamily hydrolase (TIGR01509 family)